MGNETSAASVLDIAQYVFNSMPDRENSTYMKLQKMVYYSQVESLMHYKRPLFLDKILAYSNGPVVWSIFNKHRRAKYLDTRISLGDANKLSSWQRTCVDWAFEKYGKYSGDELSEFTHAEDPWKNARGDLPRDAHCENEITRKSIFAYHAKEWEEDPESYKEYVG